MPAISTSSPGWKPASSSARITPIRLSRRSTCASASSLSTSKRASSRSIGAPLTRNTPPSPRSIDHACPAPGGTRGARRAPRRRRARRAPRRVDRDRAQQQRGQLAEPGRVALEVSTTGTSLAERARASARRAAPLLRRSRDRPSTAPERAAAARAARRGPPARARRPHGWRPDPSRRPARGRRTWTSTRVRSTCARKSWPSPAPSLAPSISPGMSARISCRSPSSSTPSTGSSVVNG